MPSSVDDLRVCVRCAHHAHDYVSDVYAHCCAHPALGVDYDVVTGDPVPRTCDAVRRDERACGRDGRLYVARRAPWWRRATEYLGW